jgi:hypothetical protein
MPMVALLGGEVKVAVEGEKGKKSKNLRVKEVKG